MRVRRESSTVERVRLFRFRREGSPCEVLFGDDLGFFLVWLVWFCSSSSLGLRIDAIRATFCDEFDTCYRGCPPPTICLARWRRRSGALGIPGRLASSLTSPALQPATPPTSLPYSFSSSWPPPLGRWIPPLVLGAGVGGALPRLGQIRCPA